MINYSYAVLKYRHDLSAGEVLNVGVVLFAPATGQIGFQFSPRYARLSEAFAGFDGDTFRTVMNRLETALARVSRPLTGNLFELESREVYEDVAAVLRKVWPDQGLAYFAGPPMSGVADDLDLELRDLFDRFVLSQHDKRDAAARYDDEAVWNDVRSLLTARGITAVLQPKALGPAEVEFQHTYKNDKWHVIEPISLDYANPSDMKQKALLTLGKAAAVADTEELGSFTVIVGKPRRTDMEKKYHEAMRLLADLPVPHRVVDADDKEKFAAQLEAELRAHGLLK